MFEFISRKLDKGARRVDTPIINVLLMARNHTDETPPSAQRPLSWARLLKRVFEIDMTACSKCGGPLTIIAAIVDPPVITKILAHLGLPQRAPPRSPAKAYPLLQMA